MKKNSINIGFTDFIIAVTLIFFSMGVIIGLTAFIKSCFGEIYLNLGLFQYKGEGVEFGVLALFISPVINVFLGLMYSIITYYPFKFLLNLFNINMIINCSIE